MVEECNEGNGADYVGLQLTEDEQRRLLYEPVLAIKPIVEMHDRWMIEALDSKKRL